MMLGAQSALTLTLAEPNAAGFDVRLAVLNVWVFIACRPLFLNAYVTHPMFRLLPLMVGGFWTNACCALYSTLMLAGVKDSQAVFYGCIAGGVVAVLGYIVYLLGQLPKPEEEAKKGK
eukprot:TRINITY_DN22528_c0_g1_i2.p2 TRINITY_DN22528_c0_g1~~TRINITY_DN22528_c0_g1_i2.p2  ORF type:complete len:118 (+),score=26.72 TRINITY_DN22528_c0_g1_i2:158-511(+)